MMRAGRLLAAATIVLLACDGGPGEPDVPVPGQLVLRLTTPNTGDVALQLRIGALIVLDTASLDAGSGIAAYVRSSSSGLRVMVFGALNDGAVLLRLEVPDVRRAADYGVVIEDVADAANNTRASLAGYAVTIDP